MKHNKKQTAKKDRKSISLVKIGYVIGILAIVVSILWIIIKKVRTPEPIDFTTDGAIGIEAEKYAYLNVQGLSTEIDLQNNSQGRYYIAYNGGYMYIVKLDFKTKMQLKSWQNYTNSEKKDIKEPKTEKIYGTTESISDDLKQRILDSYNEGLSEQHKIEEYEFENYFGSVLLNSKRDVGDIFVPQTILCVTIIGIAIVLILKKKHILS